MGADGTVKIKTELDKGGLQKGLGTVSSGIKTATKAIGVGLAGAATGVVALTKKAVEGYSQTEQLVGGVKKLYGNMGMSIQDYAKATGSTVDQVKDKYGQLEKAQNMVLKNASEAYKTAGMSANQYMETATQFSASLISSLGGDTVKAAQQTDKAMVAMSDNINTFGSNAEDVQNAFKGFSKQNYTMLDNLKLGYGGTKTEMERLISDANEYAKSIGQAGDLSINSFSDIVDAIDLVQQKQQIAGTTAREASTTIEGALTMTRSAWDNLVAGLADPDADIGKLIDNFVQSAGALGQNLMPVIQQALTSIANLAGKIGPLLSKQLPKAIKSVLPSILSATVNLVSGLIAALPGILSALGSAIPTVISTVMDNASGLLDAGKNLLNMLVKGITQGIPMLVTGLQSVLSNLGTYLQSNLSNIFSSGLDIVGNIVKMIRTQAGRLIDSGCDLLLKIADGFADSIPVIIEKVPAIISDIAGIINDNAPKLLLAGVQIIVKLAMGIVKAIPTLIANIPKILKAIWDVFMAFQWLNLGKTIITALKNGLVKAGPAVVNGAKNIGKAVINFFKSLPSKLLSIGRSGGASLGNGLRAMANLVKANASKIGTLIITILKSLPSKLLALGKRAIVFLANGIVSVFGKIKSAITTLGNNIINGVKSIPSKMTSIGSNIVKGLWNGINNMAGWVKSKIQGFGKGVLNALKSFFKIHSPSKLMENEVGVYIAQGVAVGIIKGSKDTNKAVGVLADTILKNTKEYTKKIIKSAKAEASKISDGVLSGFKKSKSIGDYIVSSAKKRLNEFEKNNKLTTEQEIKFWKRLRKNYEEGSDAYIKIDKKLTQAKKKLAKEREQADEDMVSKATSTLEKQKFYHNVSLQDEVDYWDKVVKKTKKGTEARYQADQKYAEAKKALDEKVLEIEKTYADGVKEVNDKLAEDINSAWEKYQSAWDSSYNSMLTKFSQLEEFTRKDVIGIGQLTQNIQDSNDATRDYEQYIALLANNPIIPEELLEQIKGFGVENVETIKAIAEATPEQLQAYIDAWNEKVQLASQYADSENANLKEQTNADIEELKEKAQKDIIDLTLEYKKSMAELGKTVKKSSIEIGTKIGDGMSEGISQKKSDVTKTTKDTANGAVTIAQRNVNGKPVGKKIVNDTISAIQAGKGSIANTISQIVSEVVSSAIASARAQAESQASSVAKTSAVSSSSSSSATSNATKNSGSMDLFSMLGSNTKTITGSSVNNVIVNVDKVLRTPAQIMQETKTAIRFAGIKAR